MFRTLRSLFVSSANHIRKAKGAPRRDLFLENLEERNLLAAVHFAIDPQQNVEPISRFIYGVNESLSGPYSNNTFTRLGGNRWTAYNWENNASNAGSDYIFQNDDYLGGGNTPGGAMQAGIQNASAHNAGILLTVPINGYVAADKNGDGNVMDSGPDYLQTRFKQELPTKGAAFTLTPDPNDSKVYQDEFVNWVKTNYPYSQTDPNRPIWYSLDNEPDLWMSTHQEVHPDATTYSELIQKSVAYASAIKSVSPNSLVFGPANYGYYGYITLQDAPDANGRDFQDVYLQEMNQASTAAGKRLLDSLDVHWYPEATGGGVRITEPDSSPAVVAARVQAPRSLWDPTYTETSWITQYATGGPITLLPRLQDKIDNNFPGTKLSISEYNYGGGGDISGGIAQADVLGIYGRDGVFAANEWRLNADESFIGGAFQMYRNFDGANGTFGDLSVQASTDNVADTSVYASIDSTNSNVMTLVVINKTAQPITSALALSHVQANATADIYQLTSASSNPQHAGQVTITDPANFNYTMPAYSVSTIRIASQSTSGVTANLVNGKLVINGTPGDDVIDVTPVPGQTSNIQVLSGGVAIAGASFPLTSITAGISITGGAGNDTLRVNAAITKPVTLDSGSGNDKLVGGAGNDRYIFTATSALGSDTVTDAGGTDTLDFSGTSNKAVVVNLGTAAAQVVNSNLTLSLGSASAIENVVGTPLNDTLTGNGLNNSLNGGAGNDIYSFDTDIAQGNDSISDSAGTDTLTFAATTTKGVTVNLGVATAQVVNSNLTLTLGSASSIENVVGGTLDDKLTGNSLNNILNGQVGNDLYSFDTDTAQGSDTISESGVGIDTLNFTSTTTKNVAVNLGIATAQMVNSNLTLTLGSTSTSTTSP